MKKKYKLAFMEMATVFSKTSEAKRLKVGALIIKNNQVISLGVNGTPAGWVTNNCEDLDGNTSWFVRHAEMNALNKLRKSTESSDNSIMFCTHSCCYNCAIDIVDSGIKVFYYKEEYRDSQGLDYLRSHNVKVIKL